MLPQPVRRRRCVPLSYSTAVREGQAADSPRSSSRADAFKVKNQKELLLSDSAFLLPFPACPECAQGPDPRSDPLSPAAQGKSVFLSDGLKKAYDDVEYYYEEFCYKQYKERSHSNDGASPPSLPSSLRLSAPCARS